MEKTEVERLTKVETKMEDIDRRLILIDNSIGALHGKFDIITTNYVHKDTFSEYRKNQWLERILIILVTSSLTGLVAFVLRANNI